MGLQVIKKTGASEETTAPVESKKVLRAPMSKYRIIDAENEPYVPVINIALMGLSDTGKTKAIGDLVKDGARVFMLNTDPGGAGEETIVARAHKEGWYDKFIVNFKGVSLDNYDDVMVFMENPAKIYPKIWDFSPDFIVWEGFSNFQQTQLSEKVAELLVDAHDLGSSKKDLAEQRTSGLKQEQQEWGLIRNATVRRLEDFLRLRNEKTGQTPTHILTFHESVVTESLKNSDGQVTTLEKASARPLIQGAGKSFLGQGFSLVLRLTKEGNKFYYENSTKTLGLTKNRGIEGLEGKIEADFTKVIEKVENAYKVKLYERS